MKAIRRQLFLIALVLLCAVASEAQSTLADLPTPVTSNELSGTIKAREIGDSRVTTYYYWFEGGQGDTFVNLVTKNFAGDIDIFTQVGLKPLTKIVIYPDFGEVETGRIIYLRKGERLLLRVQGRTPNDDPAVFRLKFAGSFIAASGSTDSPEMPRVSGSTLGPVSVNSVGTRVAPPPQKIPDVVTAERKKTETASMPVIEQPTEAKTSTEAETKKLEVVVSDNAVPEKKEELKPAAPVRNTRRSSRRATTPPKVVTPKPEVTKAEDAKPAQPEPVTAKKPVVEKKVDPLANVNLVIEFKDGRKIERPLPEVFRFSVDRGVLTVVSKDGRIGKYQMVDVSKVTIE